MTINVIDLFAGPGGLGEGFSAFASDAGGRSEFKIRMSVEKDPSAHKTLTLRALYRNLRLSQGIVNYHDYTAGDTPLTELARTSPSEWEAALEETLRRPTALGENNETIHRQLASLKRKYRNEPWVVIGGPPCQAYSLAGRSRNKGNASYKAEDDKRHFLYREYLKVLAIMQPDIFVMENVKGILSSKVNGENIFGVIRRDLENPSLAVKQSVQQGTKRYNIYSLVTPPSGKDLLGNEYRSDKDFIIRAEEFGIPQARHRVILLGVSAELDKEPTLLIPSQKVNIEHILSGLPTIRSRLSKQTDSPAAWMKSIETQGKVIAKEMASAGHWDVVEEIQKNLNSLKLNAPTASRQHWKDEFSKRLPDHVAEWLRSDPPKLYLNHESRSHIAGDLGRYFFSACWAKAHRRKKQNSYNTPKSHDFPPSLVPAHANWKSGAFSDRFRVQAKGRPATTITSHISKDGHYFIHYDPTQCRSLTVREAARIQTFPDNYFFEGSRTDQYTQVGNAVPPMLAKQIAGIVAEMLM